MQGDGTIGNWTQAEFSKILRETIERLLPTHIPGLTVDDLIVAGSLKVSGSADFSRVRIPVGASGAPGFTNGWANLGGSWATAAYWKDQDGLVWLEGTIASGTLGAAAWPLPPGFWPTGDRIFPAFSNGTLGLVKVTAGGLVVPQTVGTASNASYSLDGIVFRTGKT